MALEKCLVLGVKSHCVGMFNYRSLDYYWQRGGNASNSASVLALLGQDVEFFGTLVRSQELRYMYRGPAPVTP